MAQFALTVAVSVPFGEFGHAVAEFYRNRRFLMHSQRPVRRQYNQIHSVTVRCKCRGNDRNWISGRSESTWTGPAVRHTSQNAPLTVAVMVAAARWDRRR